MISRLYVTCWLLARNGLFYLLRAVAALTLLASISFAQTAPKVTATNCKMNAVILIAAVDADHFRMVVAVQTQCSDGRQVIYHSKEAVIKTSSDSKDVEAGSVLMRAMCIEVAAKMQADGAVVSDQDIINHATLVDTDKAQPQPHPSPTNMVGV